MAPQAFQPPEPLSLNDLLRQHCHDRLYVYPLRWTAQHLQLLNCRFVHCQPLPPPASSTQAHRESEQPGEDSKLDKQQPKWTGYGMDQGIRYVSMKFTIMGCTPIRYRIMYAYKMYAYEMHCGADPTPIGVC
jgi:hypothetical protein